MNSSQNPVVECQMLIRKPAAEVFNAFIDPEITTNFWYTKSSGKLITGQKITWEWEMYGVSAAVSVPEVVQDKLIVINWGEPSTTVEFHFEEIKPGATYVVIKNYGFAGSGDELIDAVKDNTGGFTTVLDGMKAYLEHGIRLNLIGDKFL